MKALGLVVSDKKIFKTYFLTPIPTYVTNQNRLNNFCMGNCILKTYYFNPETYLCNQLKQFEQLW